MSTEGPQGIYCNNLEELYGVITVTKLDDGCNVILLGNPSTEFCWFPGYNKTLLFIIITVTTDFSAGIIGQ